MKIFMATHGFSRSGGIERVVYELSTRMARRGHEVHVAAARLDEDLSSTLPDGVVVHRITTLSGYTPLMVLQFGLQAAKLARDNHYDIVHSHGTALLSGDILTAHSCHTYWFRLSFRLAASPLTRVRKILNPLHPVLMTYEARQYSNKNFKAVIAVSSQVTREIQQIFKYKELIENIPNGINLEEFSSENKESTRAAVRAKLGLDDQACVLLFVGNEFRRKGLETVLHSLSHVEGNPYLIVVGGDNPEPYLKLIRSLGCEERVFFVGRTSKVAEYFSASDVFVLPTQYEPFGLVAVEAMASGIPVIISATSGIGGYLKNGVDGLLLKDPQDESALAEAINRLCLNPDLARRISSAAQNSVTQFDWENIVDKTLEVYQHVLEQKRNF